MKAKKLTPPANAPKIPKGWVYMGVDWESKVPVRYGCWRTGEPDWGCLLMDKLPTAPGGGYHYITPAPKPAKKKPAPAKAKRAGKPVKATFSKKLIRRAANQAARAAVRELEGAGKKLPFALCVDLVGRIAAEISAIAGKAVIRRSWS